jgi:membrane protein involved in colicin uptake
MAWFPSPNKFLDLIKSAETFVEEHKKMQLVKAEEVRLAAELKSKQEAEAKAAAELLAKQEADAKTAAELKARQEAEARASLTKKITINCVKGKLSKKVTAVKPKCPAGYKKK